jgi:hypothetical protein
MLVKPFEPDLVFYQSSTAGRNKQDEPLRGDLVFYHLRGSGGLKKGSASLPPGLHVILIMALEIGRVMGSPSLLCFFLASALAGRTATGFLSWAYSGIRDEILTAKQALGRQRCSPLATFCESIIRQYGTAGKW